MGCEGSTVSISLCQWKTFANRSRRRIYRVTRGMSAAWGRLSNEPRLFAHALSKRSSPSLHLARRSCYFSGKLVCSFFLQIDTARDSSAQLQRGFNFNEFNFSARIRLSRKYRDRSAISSAGLINICST